MTVPDAAVREVMLHALSVPAPEGFEDWDAVLRRAGAVRGHARRRVRRALLVALAVVALGLLVLPTSGVGSRLVELIWDEGTPVDPASLGDEDRMLIEGMLGDGWTVEQIGSDGSLAFYVIHKDGRAVCIASGPVGRRVRLGDSGCSLNGGDVRGQLPSAERPIYKSVLASYNPRTREERIERITGLVLPGISRIAAIDSAGNEVASAAVTGYVFQLDDLPDVPIAAIVAYDEDGHEVYREPLLGPR